MSVLLGLRIAVAGRREGAALLALTALGVGLGATMILLALTVQSALQGRAGRSAWQDSAETSPATAPDPALLLVVTDYYDGRQVVRVHVAALGPRPPVPPGLDRLPPPGEVAVSPALRRLLASAPDDQLDDRFPGRVTTTIGAAGLAHPDELVGVIGLTPAEMAAVSGARRVQGLATRPNSFAFTVAMRILVGITATVLLVPVVVFVVMVTRMAAGRREQRLAAIRLAGATRLQTGLVAASETGLAACAGSTLGFLGYQAGRRVVASEVTYQGAHLFLDDVVVPPVPLVLVLAGIPVVTALTTVVSLHRVQSSPLRVARRMRHRPPGAWRAWTLCVGIGGLLVTGWFRDGVGDSLAVTTPLFVACTLLGVVLVGPWACLQAGRLLARWARRASTLMAARRLAADPRTAFPGVSGVVLAVFVVTFVSMRPAEQPAEVVAPENDLPPGVLHIHVGLQPPSALGPLLGGGNVVVRLRNDGTRVVACADLARIDDIACPYPPDAEFLAEPDADSANLPVTSIFIITDGTVAAEERARTLAGKVIPRALLNTDRDQALGASLANPLAFDMRLVLRLAALFVLVVAGFSLTISTIGGLVERRRPFALLRASGMRLGELRRIVLLETGVPMVTTSLVGAAMGVATAYANASIFDESLGPPGPDLLGVVAGGVFAALAFAAASLPLLNLTVRHESIRYE